MNNLKQIGMSIAQYSRRSENGRTFGHGVYPSGTIPNPKIAPDQRCGWASLIYLLDDEGCSGCPAVYPELAWDHPLQQGATGRDSEMYCPACQKPTAAKPIVPACYVGIAGLGFDAPGLPTTDKRAGIFGDDRVVRPVDVTDGLAETMMVAESSAPAGPWFAGGRNTVRGLDTARQPYLGKGRQFGGNHYGGADVLMADGSVRFIKDTVAPKVFEALSTIAGGEKVSVP
jgi:prepilin-type processing-associated H-X9-DG protein